MGFYIVIVININLVKIDFDLVIVIYLSYLSTGINVIYGTNDLIYGDCWDNP